MPTPRAGLPGALIVLVAAALFGALGVASRFAYDAGVQPFAFVAWRAAVGALGIGLVVVALHGPRAVWANVAASGVAGRAALGLGMLLAAGVNLSMFLAFDRTTIALALLGFYTYPAMVAAASGILGREPLDLTRLVALGLALAGMAAVVLGGLGTTEAVRIDALGIALGLAAAGFQTAFVLTSRRFAAVRADVAMGTILAGSAVIAAALSVATGGVAALTQPFGQPDLVLMLIGVGLFAAALPSVLFLIGIRWIGGVRTGILMLFEPVVGVALAALFLAEGLHPLQVAGGATILAAAIIVQRGTRMRSEAAIVAPVPGGP
ncbi:MAG TPA: DMT family transporter [Candidatus Limnocylindria bacterium]|nr:DMT family transporter [Candidatus Limnocylindria bacterium]